MNRPDNGKSRYSLSSDELCKFDRAPNNKVVKQVRAEPLLLLDILIVYMTIPYVYIFFYLGLTTKFNMF